MSQTSLKWDTHNKALLKVLYAYYLNQEVVDTTLIFDDGELKAHRVVLCASSGKLEEILKNERLEPSHLYFDNVTKSSMIYVVEFMYRGQVVVPRDLLPNVLKAAEYFQVKGVHSLTQNCDVTTTSYQTVSQNGMVSAVGTQNESSSSSPIRKVRPYWQRPISDVLSVTSPTLKRPREISCKDKNGKPSDEMSIAASQKNPLPSPERKQSSSTALSTLLERNGWIPKKHKSKVNLNRMNVSPRKKQIEEAGTSGCSSKVVNPFAKMSPAKKSRTSDDTFVEDPSIILKEENRFDEGPEPQLSDDDVEFLVTEDPPVVVLESVVETELSPDLLEKLPQNSNRFPDSHSDESEKACVSTRPNRPELENDSTDDELISPVTKKSCRSKIVEKVPTKIPTRQKCGKRKHEKYTKQLIQNNMKELNQFCANCFRYYKDVEGHMKKKHKTMPKKLIRCKKCGLDYYFTPFIDFHKCQKK